ncbi:MAG: tetratricopeptide repeat protein [Gammaproteobacteria bacterium]|nr:tetratricopeptide repeat protein [Gammaproteobacteria bacterium]
MNILHLSDLHFGADNARLDNGYSQLADDLAAMQCRQLDALILSGDIGAYSRPEEYRAAENFIHRLCKEFRLASEQIVIVPGNHDLNWDLSKKAYELKRREEYPGPVDEQHVIEKDEHLEVKNQQRYPLRFQYFYEFYQAVKGEPCPADEARQATLHHFPQQKLLIAGFNSAWQTDHHYRSRAALHPGAVSYILDEIRLHSEKYQNCLKIAVWHHPLNSASQDRITDADFLQRFVLAGFRIVLHGHIHKAETSLYRYGRESPGGQLEIISAGTFGAPVGEWTPGYPLQYNLLKLTGEKLVVETRRREDPNGAWAPDARWPQREGDPLPRYEISLAGLSGREKEAGPAEEFRDRASADLTASPSSKESIAAKNPYRGLEVFREEDASRFFGRERLTEQLWKTFCDLYRPAPNTEPAPRLLPLIGPSGSGKSSLAWAGLLAALKQRPPADLKKIRTLRLTPGEHPVENLARALTRLATDDKTRWPETLETRRKFSEELWKNFPALSNAENTDDISCCDGLRCIVDDLHEADPVPLVILVDQFEEFYTLCPRPEERNVFFANLLRAAAAHGGHVSIVITLRGDFLGETQPALNQLIARQGVIVPMLSEAELRDAIVKPAANAGHPLDPAVVERLIDQSKERQGALPLLQFALSQLWDGMAQGKKAATVLAEIGGVGGALARKAQQLYESLTPTDKPVARRIFLKLIQLGEGSRDTRRRAPVAEMVAHDEEPDRVAAVLDFFAQADARLITLSSENLTQRRPESREEDKSAEVTHEALLEHWDALKEWLDKGRADLRFDRRLTDAARYWREQGKPSGLLWRPPDLELLNEFHGRHHHDMTALQIEFFRAGEADWQRQEQEKENLHQREIEQARTLAVAQKKGSRLLWMVIALLIAIGAGIFLYAQKQKESVGIEKELRRQAQDQARRADEKRDEALRHQSLALTVQAKIETERGNATNGILLALEALPANLDEPNRPYVPEAEAQLYSSLSRPYETAVLQGHENRVNNAAFRPDGKRILTASADHTARLWDADTGKLLAVLEHEGSVNHAAFSPDGNHIVTASKDGNARLWDAHTGNLSSILQGHEDSVLHAAFSPDGKHIVTASEDAAVRLWDTHTGKLLTVLQEPEAWRNVAVNHAAFSPDGRRIVTTSYNWDSNNRNFHLLDVDTGKLLAVLQGDEDRIRYNKKGVAPFSPDNKHIVTISEDDAVRLWDAHTGKSLRILQTNKTDKIRYAAFNPDGKRIVMISWDGIARLWDVHSGKLLIVLQGSGVTHAAFSPDNKSIVTTSRDNTACLWDVSTGKNLAILQGHKNDVLHADFSPDSKRIVTVSTDNTVRLWNIDISNPLFVLQEHENNVSHATFSPDSKHIVTEVYTWQSDSSACLWDVRTGSLLAIFPGSKGGVIHAVSPDGKHIITVYKDNITRLWDIATGKLLTLFQGHEDKIHHVAFSPDGKRIVTVSSDSTARLWDVVTARLLSVFHKREHKISRTAFSPDGKHILTWNPNLRNDIVARLWEVSTGNLLTDLRSKRRLIRDAVFNPDGKYIVTTSWRDANAYLWDAHTGKLLLVLQGHEEPISHAVFGPDDKHIVTASYDNTARLWDIHTGKLLTILQGHENRVYHAAFNPNGKRIVTASRDHTARLWDVHTGKVLAVLQGHKDYVNSAIFSPDGKRIVTASGDNTAQLWKVLPDGQALIDHARHIVQRRLTPKQRKRFFLLPDKKYTETVQAQRSLWLTNIRDGDARFAAHENQTALQAYEQALEHAEKLSILSPGSVEARWVRSRTYKKLAPAYLYLRQWDKALAAYSQQFEEEPEVKNIWYKIGTDLRTQRREEALIAFRRQLELDHKHKVAWFGLANVLQGLQKWSEANEAYRSFLELEPDHVEAIEAWENLGAVLQKQDKWDEATKAYRTLIELEPKHAKAWNNLGTVLQQQNKLDEAIKTYHALLELKPKHKTAWYDLGNILRTQRKPAEALTAYRQHVEALPGNQEVWVDIGDIHVQQKQWKKAAIAYRDALRANYLNIETWRKMGTVRWKQGELTKARAAFARGLGINRYSMPLLIMDAQLALVQGEPARSKSRIKLALSRKAQENIKPDDQIHAILPFLNWLAEPTGGWEPVLDAIKELKKKYPELSFSWDFSLITPALERLNEADRRQTEAFIAFFEGRTDLAELEKQLEQL